MKIAILGYDTEGKVSYDYFAAQDDNEITILDQNPNAVVPQGAESVLGETYLDNLDRFDLIVRTAGLSPDKIFDKNSGVADRVTTHINEFLKACPTRHVIGVTGTKGKGTTSTLIAKMLEAVGKDVYLGGNIGLPPITFLDKLNEESRVVLELSSFQLIDVNYAPHIAVCLMVVPEHLDWHKDQDEYFKAKARLFSNQTMDDIAIYFGKYESSTQIASVSPGEKIPYYEPPGAYVKDGTITIDGQVICQTDELKLLGAHNWQNVCAALTVVWRISQDIEAMRSVLTTFTGLPHRLELVRELDGVKYYDDSFGTTPETAIVAVQAFSQPVIAIMGGRGKGIPFDQLAKAVVNQPNVKHVITMGETGHEIAEALQAEGYKTVVKGKNNIDDIVAQARELAEPGDVVVLSTGSTSFDMFENYKDRGDKFTAAVKALS